MKRNNDPSLIKSIGKTDASKLLFILWGIVVVYSFWKATIGMMTDELFQIQFIDLMSEGRTFVKESWGVVQFSTIISIPLYRLYEMITGSHDGIILFLRIVSLIIQFLISLFLYKTFRDKCKKEYCIMASIVFYCFVADHYTFSYKQQMIWFVMLNCIFLYRYLDRGKIMDLLGMSIASSLGVLAYPTVMFIVVFAFIVIFTYDKEKRWKSFGIYIAGCAFIGLIFIATLCIKPGMGEVINSIHFFFGYSPYGQTLKSKCIHSIVKLIAMVTMSIIPLAIVNKIGFLNKILKKTHLSICVIELIGAFLIQTFIERKCITWHIETYPYIICLGILIFMYGMNKDLNTEDRIIRDVFISGCLTSFIAAMIASDQPNITSMYSGIFACVGLMIMMGRIESDRMVGRECPQVVAVLLLIAVSVTGILVYESESVRADKYTTRTVFAKRYLSDKGPTKGIRIGDRYFEKISNIYTVIDSVELKKDDHLLIIDEDDPAMCGEIYADCYQAGSGNKLESYGDFYIENPKYIPTKVLIKHSWIEENTGDKASLGDYYVISLLENDAYEQSKVRDYYLLSKKQ